MVRVTKIELIDKILLVGAPGIGKTEVIKEKAMEEARKMGREFVDLREVDDAKVEEIKRSPSKYYIFYRIVAPHVFPEDLAFPKKVNDGVEYIKFLTPREIAILTLKDIAGVLFIDEITNLQRKDQISMYFSLIQEKEVAWNVRFSKGIKLILAGNPPEHSSVANLLPAPMVSRITIVEVEPPTVEEWAEYMYSKYPHASKTIAKVVGYLNYYKGDFIKTPKETETLENFPTPRNWTELTLTLHELEQRKAPREFIRDVIVGRVGKEVGARFYSYIKRTPPPLKELLSNPSILDSMDIETKILAMTLLAQNVDKVIKDGKKLINHLLQGDKDMLLLMILTIPRSGRRKLLKTYTNIVRELASELKDYIAQL